MKGKSKIMALAACACALALVVTGCGTAQQGGSAGGGHSLDKQAYPFLMQVSSEDDMQEDQIDLYFVDGGEIPYVSLGDYLSFVGGLYGGDGLPSVEYDIKADGSSFMATRTDNGSMMGVDAETDVLSFSNFDAFVMEAGDSTMMGLVGPAGEESNGLSTLFQDAGMSYEHAGKVVVINLSDYGIQAIMQDGQAYLPLQTVNDVLVSGRYVQVVFDGQEVLAGGYNSGFLEREYEAPTGQMSEELSAFNYNELRLYLDNFYGLVPEHEIDGFVNYFADTGLLDDLVGTDPVAFDTALANLLTLYLDDSHSAFLQPSYLSGADAQTAIEFGMESGASGSGLNAALEVTEDARAKYYPQLAGAEKGEVNLYEEVGDTAIITFDEFKAAKGNYREEADLSDPQDTIELVAYAHRQITREGSPIKNVVIDLSCNPGGEGTTAMFVIAWYKNVAQVALRSTLTGAQSVASYTADINLDGEFDESDQLPADLNLYCLTSQGSFSCGNLVPAAFKDSTNITMLGRTTGGGACIVLPGTTAIGTSFQISGTMQLGVLKNGSFYSADTGIEPDFTLGKWDTFYDRQALVDFIHDLK